ncbi:metallopeptidase TldD-related protein [Rhodococcoides kyotonense]|uniref:Predicted Zn-dependent protease or its inactivated homolog n=1 Tax=Rhodococcoides kyotonense TaxID=398843 RepID=A0A239CIP5_9NOCA|nr:metallopeptidase TldD-related protein [Rhodococcus kyotonensis]SNS19782.1 Predicted Zn-dependent protease or its inactivated homolog [Rhodococcus kyotonensis]
MIPGHDVVERVLSLATVDETFVIVTDSSEASLRWAGNSMTTNGIGTSRTWTVVSIVRAADGTKVSTVSSTSVDPDDIASVVAACEKTARTAETAEDAMPSITGAGAPDDWNADTEHTTIDVFGGFTADLAAGFDRQDQLYGFAHHRLDTVWLGSSSGIRRRFTQPTGSIEINGKRDDASAWVGASTKRFDDVNVAALLDDLSTRLGWASRHVDLPAGRYETVLPPSAVADLMIYLMWTMEGRGAQEGHTALSKPGGTRVGEKLGRIPLTLYSDPAEPGLEYSPFVAAGASNDSVSVFDNGMSTSRVEWVQDGAVGALAYPRFLAKKYDTDPVIPGDNLILTGGSDSDLDAMIARTERGLLLTTLWYIREVDPATLLLTGLTRDGVYLVEDGKVTGAVNNFRFNESPLDLLRRVTEAGATEKTLPREWKDWFTRTAMPPLRIPDFHMSSVSKAQ